MAILYTGILLMIVKSYEGRNESGAAAAASGSATPCGLLRRRRDHEYAARAQMPENM